jgi:hypothetical protein
MTGSVLQEQTCARAKNRPHNRLSFVPKIIDLSQTKEEVCKQKRITRVFLLLLCPGTLNIKDALNLL